MNEALLAFGAMLLLAFARVPIASRCHPTR